MATAIGITSGVITLATFTFDSSVSLYQTVRGFQSAKRGIRELEEELEALRNVSQLLKEASCKNEAQFVTLSLPLLRCGHACRDFENVIVNYTGHSSGSMSFQGWSKLRYMGMDIAEFKNMLAGYKSTINIALAAANLYVHTSSPSHTYLADMRTTAARLWQALMQSKN